MMIKLRKNPGAVVALSLAIVVGSIAVQPSAVASAQDGRVSLDGAVGWINSDGPIHLEKLRGKIVLLDFWTYCCINCQHVLPDLAILEQKYKNQLVVIGVHTAKFDAEKATENIRSKVREYKIRHPVANDANQTIWDRFNVRGWPTLVVIDANGEEAKRVSGEGHGADLDAVISSLVAKHKSRGELDETPVEFPTEVEKPDNTGLLYPGKVTADAGSKRLFISDTGHNRIVVTDLEGKLIETIGNGKPGLVDGDFASSSLNRPQGTCLFEGVLYVADTENHALRSVDFTEKSVKTVAGTGLQGHSYTASGRGLSTALNSPWDVLPIPIAGTKLLAIAMAGPHQIWRYDISKGTIAHWAGSGRENIVDGTVSTAQFAQPSGLATDGQHLFVADSEVSGVRSITLNSQHRVGTIVGTGLFRFGDVDGQAENVRLQHCLGLAYGDGKLYIADTYNNKVKVCEPKTRSVKTLATTTDSNGTAEPATFNEPGGLSLMGSTLYVADTNHHAIREVDLRTNRTRTLDLSTVRPPVREKVYKFNKATIFNLPPMEVVPGKELNVLIEFNLPTGYKLSTEAPVVYLAEANRPNVFASEVSTTGQNVENPSKVLKIRLPLARQALTGSSFELKFSLSAFVCLPNSLCTVKNYVWTVPVTFNPGRPAELKLSTAKP